MANTLCIIPARGGSKGIPRKNLRGLAGKPLIAHVIETARSVEKIDVVVVTTDDEEIAATAARHGAEIIMRPAHLAEDDVTMEPVVAHALEESEARHAITFAVVVTVQPTSPLLSTRTLTHAIERFAAHPELDTLLAAREERHLSWSRTDGGFVPNYTERKNRAHLPPVYHETGAFFLCTGEILRRTGQRFGTAVDIMVVPAEEAVDIDDNIDWALAEAILTRRRVAVVVAGNRHIGLGHVYRVLALASDLARHEIAFFVEPESHLAAERIRSVNYAVVEDTWPVLLERIGEYAPDVVVNDTLDTTVETIQQLRATGARIVSFEDLGPGADLADAVVNALYPERHVRENAYHGSDYFVARDEFVYAPTKQIVDDVRRVLVTFGGTDPGDLTRAVLAAIGEECHDRGIRIDVVLGPGYPEDRVLEQPQHVSVYRDVLSMADRMLEADIVFTSAGRTVYEVACLGIPAIVLAQNPRELSHFFASADNGFVNLGLGTDLQPEEIRRELVRLVERPEARRLMHERMMVHDLRSGRARVVDLILNGNRRTGLGPE